jgi:PAS domain S-box-containing protein
MKNKTTSKKTTAKRTRKSSKAKSNSSMEKALRKSQHMLEMVINNVPQHIFWKDVDSVFLGCNKNFAKTVGLNDPEEVVGKTDFDLTDKNKAEHFIEIDKKVILENQPIYGMRELHKNSDGKEVWLNVNKVPLCDEKGKVVGVLGTFEDITSKINLSDKLEKNAKKYKALIEQTNTAYIIMDTKFRIVEANKNFFDLIGSKSDKEIIGRNPRCWVFNGDVKIFDEAFNALLAGLPINDLELTFINDKNVSIDVTVNANVIENGGKRIFCLLRNISHRKIEEKKKYIEQQKRKDKLRQNIMEIRGKLRDIRSG